LAAALALGALAVAGMCVVYARRPADAKAPPAAAQGSRPCRALLVGVSSYHPDTRRTRDGRVVLPALKGTRNDVARMADVLAQHGFGAADVRTLGDSEATVENVVRAFADHLIAGVTKDTEVVLFFSGHGSRVPDRSGREPGGMDSSYLLYDSRVDGAPPRDLDDDALHSLLAACPSERVTVITDCCNSGNLTRGGGGGVTEIDGVCYELLEPREVEAAEASARPDTWPFWPAGVPWLEDGAAGRRVPLPWVHVPACAAHEPAHEINVHPKGHPARGRAFGAMTHYLCMELMQTPPGTSWDVVFARMRERLCRVAPGQHPHLEGPGRRVVFGTRLLPAVFGVPARLRDDGRLALEGGAFTGMVKGMACDVVRLSDQARVGRCIVDEVDATTAIARWETPPGGTLADDVLRAVPATPGDPARALPLARSTLGLIDAALRPKLLELAWLRVTDEEEGVYRFARGAGGDVSLRAPDGYHVWSRAKDLPVIDGLTLDVRCEVEFQNLWALGNRKERGGIPLPVAIVAATAQECEALVAGARAHHLDRFEPAPIPAADRSVPPRVEMELLSAADQVKAKVGRLAMYEFGPARGTAHVVALELDPSQRTARQLDTAGRSAAQTQPRRVPQWIFAAAEDQWPHPTCTFRFLVLASDREFDVSGLLPVRETTRGGDALAGVDPATWSVGAVDLVVRRQ
jgi:hypothetical protein